MYLRKCCLYFKHSVWQVTCEVNDLYLHSSFLHLCHTFPWTAEWSWWFPGRQPVFAPLLCSCRCSHNERTLLSAPRTPSQWWPEPIWAPQVPSAGHQLRQRANWESASCLTTTAQQLTMGCVPASRVFTSPVATVKFQPDVPQLTVFQWSLSELLQSLRMIQ